MTSNKDMPAINSHGKLTQQVKDLEFSLDDRDCYIADADMKNEALTQQVAELRAVLKEVFIISDRSNEQNINNFDHELAMQHNEDICEIYHILESLKEGE